MSDVKGLEAIRQAAAVIELAAIEYTEARHRGNEEHIEITRRRLEAARETLAETARACLLPPTDYRANLLLAADYIRRRSKARTAPSAQNSTPRHTRLVRLEQALLEYAGRSGAP